MTKYTSPSGLSPTEWIGTICGCDSRAAVSASRTKRSRISSRKASSGGSTLTATWRFNRSSRAWNTTPTPPRPISPARVEAPVGAGRPTTLRAIEAALKSDSRLIFAVAQRENVDTVPPDVLYTTGTITKISQIQRGLGGVQLLLHGERRGTALHYTDNGRYLEAVVHEVDDLPPLNAADPAFVALHREARERAAELGQKSGLPEDVVRQVLEEVSDPGRLADLVAGYLEVLPAQRQGLLETLSVEERLRRVLIHVQRQIGVLDAQEHIKSQVHEELGESQGERFLREQRQAIGEELGEEHEVVEVDELRKRLGTLDLPEAAKKEVDRELQRLERANRDSMEAQVIRTYVETMA